MQLILSESFENALVPAGWLVDSRCHTFEQGCLRTGKQTSLWFALPGHGWRKTRIEVEIQTLQDANISCECDGVPGLGSTSLRLTLSSSEYARHAAFKYQREVAHRDQAIPSEPGFNLLAFEFDHGCLRAYVDEDQVIQATDSCLQSVSHNHQLYINNDCLIRSIRVFGDEPLVAPAYEIGARNESSFSLEVCVDFVDDLVKAPFTREMFRDLFAEFKSWGVTRVHWIYYGKQEEGWWDHASSGSGENAIKTFASVGDIFRTAVEASHEQGIELFGLIKPFDMGLKKSHGEHTADAETKGRIPRIGGPVGWAANFVAQNRQLGMARKPSACGDASNETITRIDLVKENDRPYDFSIEDVDIFVSDDNETYRRYSGPIHREEITEEYPAYIHTSTGAQRSDEFYQARVIRFSGLKICQKYVAIAVKGLAGSFSNKLIDLLHVFGETDEVNQLTYGTFPRFHKSEASNLFQRGGVEFDHAPGVPTAVFAAGYDAVTSPFIFDAGYGFLAFARGKDAETLAALSPSFSETRQWWLSWVRDILDAGADGVELRVRNHHSDFAWGEYGFERPVVEAFKARYGVDLLSTDTFDRANFYRLRGESYTQFYREAKQIAQEHGKPLGLHVSITMDTEPEEGAAMGVHWDWRTWLAEGLADSVTMKEVWPGTRFSREILSFTREKGISAVFCPYANHLWSDASQVGTPREQDVIEGFIQMARDGGYDGYQFYECAGLIDATEDGKLVMRQPGLRDLFRKYFAGKELGQTTSA